MKRTLRTLKDITHWDFNNPSDGNVSSKKLRELAIQHIREFIEKRDRIIAEDEELAKKDKAVIKFEDEDKAEYWQGKIKALVDFCNIGEEDLDGKT